MFWGLASQLPVLKVRVPDVEYRPFAPVGEAPSFDSRLIVSPRTRCGVYSLCLSLSYLLRCGFLLFSMRRVPLPGCRFSSEEIVPYTAMDSVHLWEKVNSESSDIAIFLFNILTKHRYFY